jgi:hypothetical protein
LLTTAASRPEPTLSAPFRDALTHERFSVGGVGVRAAKLFDVLSERDAYVPR